MQSSHKPKISIITVTYNAGQHLEQTIKSILEQDYSNIEYIIIDGASSDDSIEIIKKYDSQITYWVSERDSGIYEAMNKGIDAATGEWINFMNAGDSFSSPYILSQIFNQTYTADVLYTDSFIVNNRGSILRKEEVKELSYLLRPEMPFIHQSSFIRTCLMKKNKFRQDYRLASDIDLFIKLYVRKHSFYYLKDIVIANFLAGGIHTFNMVKYISEATNSLILEHPNIQEYANDLGVIHAFENFNNQALTFFPSLLSSLLKNLDQTMRTYNKVILYGYGMFGKIIYSHYSNKITAIADKFLVQNVKSNDSETIIGIEEIKNFQYDAVVISLLQKETDIIAELELNGVPKDKIVYLKLS